jgi:hypothetical protein
VVVSSVPQEEIFFAARAALLKYIGSFLGSGAIGEESFSRYPKEQDGDFSGVVRFLKDNSSDKFTIVVDDGPPFSLTDAPDLEPGKHYDVWLPGDTAPDRLPERLRRHLDARCTIDDARAVIESQCDGKIALNNYSAIPEFLVYRKQARTDLRKQVDTIKSLVQKEQGKGRPICVFLSGAPGSGKSYFVEKCARVLGANDDYPITSLSGVSDERFDSAVDQHVELVFNREVSEQVAVAFLDEIDTIPKTHHAAFRLLMDAMTGNRTTELGLSMKGSKSGKVAGLVWFFAGSAGRNREEFTRRLRKIDRKVTDFFDRIHFHIDLPGADHAGQAIVQALASIKKYDQARNRNSSTTRLGIKLIEKNALLLLGATPWSSVRQLDTICRLAIGRLAEGEAVLNMAHFEGVGTIESFHTTWEAVTEAKVFGDQYVEVDWGRPEDS